MDKIKKYVISLFDDPNAKSYLFDYDVFVATDPKSASRIIVDEIEKRGFDYSIMQNETEKTRRPVFRIETYTGRAYYRFYVLGLSDTTSRVMAIRIDPWWVYVVVPLLLFLEFFGLLYAMFFMNLNYYVDGVIFILTGLAAWATIYFSEKYLISDIIDTIHRIDHRFGEINKKENKKVIL